MLIAVRYCCCLAVAIIICQSFGQQKDDPTKGDYVDGDLVTFNANGTWCWFQDERAVVDTVKNLLITGSAAMGGAVDAMIYDINEKKLVSKTQIGKLTTDDHNSPAFLVLPNGKYLTMFADHYDKYNSHYCIYDGTKWSAERKFDWTKIPGGTNYTIAYSNLYYLKTEEKIYNFARANNRSPNFMVSTDNGETWQFGGQLTTDPSNTYNKGYYKYWGNGIDRIDFCCTEQHPRDYTTSIYHGYIKDGKCHTSDGQVVDDNINDVKNLPVASQKLTKVFANGTNVNGVSLTRCWQSDIQVYEDGSIAILLEGRANNSEYDHRNIYARYNGKEWKYTYIGKAGTKMYDSEQDYTGLGALCPDDPSTIYLSSPHNPGDDNSKAGKREIWRGVTRDSGATWEWTSVTANSSKDNFRPIVPKWNKDNTVVLWWRGSYSAAQQFNAAVVGVFYKNAVGTKTGAMKSSEIINNVSWNISYSSRTRGIILHCSLPVRTGLTASLFTASGKNVVNYHLPTVSAGVHPFSISTKALTPGMYVCKLHAGGGLLFSQRVIVQ